MPSYHIPEHIDRVLQRAANRTGLTKKDILLKVIFHSQPYLDSLPGIDNSKKLTGAIADTKKENNG